jgi:hypothetical protein
MYEVINFPLTKKELVKATFHVQNQKRTYKKLGILRNF